MQPVPETAPSQPLDRAAAGELSRRLQFDQLADQLNPEELQSFAGTEASRLKGLSAEPWHDGMPQQSRELLKDLQRSLPPGIVQDLLNSKRKTGLSSDVIAHIQRSIIQQTAPGQGVDGSGSLPGGPPAPRGETPVLPTPDIKERPDQPGGSQCQAPDNFAAHTPSADAFAKKARATVGPGGTGIPYCRDGFSDVVLLDRAKPQANMAGQICSGVRIAPSWVLTAGHCVEHWTDENRGRIFGLLAGGAKCLDSVNDSARHPGEICGLPILKRTGPAKAAPPRTNGYKIDLALVPIEPRSADRLRTASVVRFDTSQPFEVTLAGFGKSPGNPAGRFRIGWSQVLAPKALIAMAKGTDEKGIPLPSVPIEFRAADYGNERLVSWACGGDSGGPVFAGRVFGYANEPHHVAAIIVESSFERDRCLPGSPSEIDVRDTQRIISLIESPVREWLCSTTASALPICR